MPKTLSTYPICHFWWIPHKFLGAAFRIRADSHLNNKSERVASNLTWTVILTINLPVDPIFEVSPKIKWPNSMARHFMTPNHMIWFISFVKLCSLGCLVLHRDPRDGHRTGSPSRRLSTRIIISYFEIQEAQRFFKNSCKSCDYKNGNRSFHSKWAFCKSQQRSLHSTLWNDP